MTIAFRSLVQAVPNPAGALPWQILAILLVGFFASVLFAIRKISNLPRYLSEPPFPTHAATTVAGILGFLGLVVVAVCRAALGMEWPDGYDLIVALVGGFAGIVGAWAVGKRATSSERDFAKTQAALSIQAASPRQPTQVLAASGSAVNVSTQAQPVASDGAPDDGAVG